MRIAIDVGGTFTDFAWEVDGKIHTGKVPTTRPHPSAGVFNGVDALMGDLLKEAPWVIHASTLASNTAIERTGAETAVLTTSGFRDVLLIGRQKRYDVYDVSIRRPQPLVQRRRIREVDERTAADGSIVRPLAEEQVIELAQELEKAGVESVAICFLNSYASNEHEQQARSLLAEAAPSLYVSTSGDVAPQWREYERFSTTVLNAYLGPILANYFASVTRGLEDRGFRGQLLVMQSSGGVAPAETMERYPVRLLESGPAAGVLMAADLSRRLGIANLLSFDMGGTTAKVGLIQGGVVNVTDSFEIAQIDLKPRSGLPVMIPSVDVIEIGAGGGSIARAVRGLIEVGPRSAGADPGPACYARGGDQPTVTDADLVLGYLNADYFAGGSLRLDQEMANKAVKTLGDTLNVGLVDAAWSIHHIVNINMASAAKAASISRGIDVRDFALLAFGGAGPIHAARIAEELAIPRVVIPPGAGVGSAVGLLAADARFDLVRTMQCRLSPSQADSIERTYNELQRAADDLLQGMGPSSETIYRRSADLRYVGQGFEVRTEVPDGRIDQAALKEIVEAFHTTYARINGQADRGRPVEGTNWRLAAIRPTDVNGRHEHRAAPGASVVSGSREAYFPELGGFIRCNVYARHDLPSGFGADGPAIVEEDDCTTVVPARWKFAVDDHENLVLSFVGDRDGN
jgi:N-methylhydantoinase A